MATKKRPSQKKRRAAKKHFVRKRSAMSKRAPSRGKAKRTGPGKAGSISTFASQVLAVFTQGVQSQLEALARKQVPTVAIIDGKEVRGIPQKVGDKYVLVPPNAVRGNMRMTKR